LAATFFLTTPPTGAEAPLISKVEPPNWWAGMPDIDLQILVTGANLQNAHVKPMGHTLPARVELVSPDGRYVFLRVHLSSATRPGKYRFLLVGSKKEASFTFVVEEPLQHAGRFQGFGAEDIVYLAMPDRFADGDPATNDPPEVAHKSDRTKGRGHHGGDLAGIIRRLPYLEELGVTALWLTPIYKNLVEESYHGYWTVDYYAVEPHLADLKTYQAMVNKAHERGLKVIQDQVLNHTGPTHPWVDAPPTPGWYNGTRARHLASGHDIPVLADPGGTQHARQQILDGWFAGVLPDLNQDDPRVEQYLIQNSIWWIAKTGVDGVRLDAYPYAPRSFWARWHKAVKSCFPNLTVVGEVMDYHPDVVAFFQGGQKGFDGIDTGLDMVMDFPLCQAMRGVFAGKEKMSALAAVLRHDRLYPNPANLMTLYGNHDISRLATLAHGDVRRLKLANVFLLTCRGIPQLYYGDEIGMEGGEDPDNRRDFPGGFPGDPRSAFDSGQRTDKEKELLAHWKQWIDLRKKLPALRKGTQHHLHVDNDVYVFLRSYQSERVIVALSKAAKRRTVDVPVGPELKGAGRFVSLLDGATLAVEENKLRLTLPPWQAGIWQARP
jgi:glycosidase